MVGIEGMGRGGQELFFKVFFSVTADIQYYFTLISGVQHVLLKYNF